MGGCLLLSRGLTRAQIMQRMVENAGIRANIVRPPREIAVDGCGYAVRVAERDLQKTKIVLRNGHINPTKIYLETAQGHRLQQ